MNIIGPFKIHDAARLSGLEKHMVDYLCRHDIVNPSASQHRVRGKARLFTMADVLMLRSIKQLLNRGISVLRLKKAIQNLQRKYPNTVEGKFPERFLVTNGEQAFFRSKDGALEDLNSTGQYAFSFLIDLEAMRDQVIYEIRASAKKAS